MSHQSVRTPQAAKARSLVITVAPSARAWAMSSRSIGSLCRRGSACVALPISGVIGRNSKPRRWRNTTRLPSSGACRGANLQIETLREISHIVAGDTQTRAPFIAATAAGDMRAAPL